jgi:adenosylhomocysteine nucleosidase
VKIGILVALPQEMRSLTKEKVPQGSCKSLTPNIIVCQTGVGSAKTKKAAQQLLSLGVELLISWGSAAGLSPDLSGGDLILPHLVKSPTGTFTAHDSFYKLLLSEIPKDLPFHQGPICQTEEILDSIDSKTKLFSTTRCLAADMESAALAELASYKHIPFAVVRAISDPANLKLPKALLQTLMIGSEFNTWKFLKKAILFPNEWFLILKLAKNFQKARKTLNIGAASLKAIV